MLLEGLDWLAAWLSEGVQPASIPCCKEEEEAGVSPGCLSLCCCEILFFDTARSECCLLCVCTLREAEAPDEDEGLLAMLGVGVRNGGEEAEREILEEARGQAPVSQRPTPPYSVPRNSLAGEPIQSSSVDGSQRLLPLRVQPRSRGASQGRRCTRRRVIAGFYLFLAPLA